MNKKETLALCYAGGVTTERENADAALACQLEFARICAENDCHYHLYAIGYSEERFTDWIECEKTNPYFHLHKPVSHRQLVEEIAQFDYGIIPVKKSFRNANSDNSYQREKFTYAGTNKHFDYLQAGLPIISPIPEMMMQEMKEKCDCVLLWAIEEIDFDYLRANKERLKQNCLKNRHIYNIKNQIPRLLEFYESVRK